MISMHSKVLTTIIDKMVVTIIITLFLMGLKVSLSNKPTNLQTIIKYANPVMT